jgi:hypothetical protein
MVFLRVLCSIHTRCSILVLLIKSVRCSLPEYIGQNIQNGYVTQPAFYSVGIRAFSYR